MVNFVRSTMSVARARWSWVLFYIAQIHIRSVDLLPWLATYKWARARANAVLSPGGIALCAEAHTELTVEAFM